ncbi:MAG: TonB family protein, partial [Bryobacteraceae bacterium]
MIPLADWSNLLSYFLQVLLLVLCGGALPLVFRMREPRVRLLYWQCLLLSCVVLPFAQPWQQPDFGVEIAAASQDASAADSISILVPERFRPEELAWMIVCAGALVRALWLALGFWRLRRYVRRSRAAESLAGAVAAIEKRLGARATVRLSDEIPVPVTFGVLKPAVLLPARFLEMPPAAQEAILCHELLHVRRRDWPLVMLEEFAAVLLWFHPAVWWLLSQIRLAREQTVDLEVIARTNDRDEYLNTLLTTAGCKGRLDLYPATLFLSKRHLVRRIGSLMKEVSMSRKHVIASLTSSALLLAATAWFAARTLPLTAAPQSEITSTESGEVSAQTGGIRLQHRPVLFYPSDARTKRIEGTVILEIEVNEGGTVTDARVLSGPEELRSGALQSVLHWRYANEGRRERLQVSLDYRLRPQGQAADPGQQILAKIKPGVVYQEASPAAFLTPQSPGIPRIRVGGNVQSQKVLDKKLPIYPPEAKQARIQGKVRLDVLIGTSGRVQ